jgi:hypothetical protein
MANLRNKKVDLHAKDALNEARTLVAPKWQKGKPLPAKVGRVYSLVKKKEESFYAPNGQMMTSVSHPRKTDKVYVRLKEKVLTDDNKQGIKNRVRAMVLPFRTDENELIDEGFSSEEILAYVVGMKGHGKKFGVDFITDDMLEEEKTQRELGDDEMTEEILEQRSRKADQLARQMNKSLNEVEDIPTIEHML